MKGGTAAVALALVMLAAQGCIFSPRDADKPSTGEQDTWIVPNTPKDVFLNMKSGFASSRNSNYERSLDAGYGFVPRPEDAAQLGQAVFEGWTKEVELGWLTRVKEMYLGARTVQFGDANGQFPTEDIRVGKAIFEGPYKITVDPGDGGESETYAGLAQFVIEQKSQGWVMTLWEDFDVNGNFSTSGYLRGTLRSTAQ